MGNLSTDRARNISRDFQPDVPLDDLTTFPGNARRGRVNKIRRSLASFTQYRPLTVLGDTLADDLPAGTVLVGNNTLAAMKLEGWTSCDVYRMHGLDADQARAILILDNKLNDEADYDVEALVALLDGLSAAALDESGFTASELDTLRASLEVSGRTWANRPVRALPDNPTSKLGQRWRLGPHVLTCGDSTDPASWDGLEAEGGASLLLTDPPYGQAYSGSLNVARDAIAGDSTGDEAARLLSDVLDVLPLRQGAPSYVFAAVGVDGVTVQAMLAARGLMRWGLVWAKDSPTMGRADWRSQHEVIVQGGDLDGPGVPVPALDDPDHAMIAYGWRPGATHPRVTDRRRTTLLSFPRAYDNKTHPTMKPVPLLEHLIGAHNLPADAWVADAFGGSGSTLVAAHTIGVRCWMVEREPAYCDVILSRWLDGTGIAPEEVSRG